MGWTEVGQYSKVVKCPLENQYFASYIAIAAIYFERICIVIKPWTEILDFTLEVPEEIIGGTAVIKFQNKVQNWIYLH